MFFKRLNLGSDAASDPSPLLWLYMNYAICWDHDCWYCFVEISVSKPPYWPSDIAIYKTNTSKAWVIVFNICPLQYVFCIVVLLYHMKFMKWYTCHCVHVGIQTCGVWEGIITQASVPAQQWHRHCSQCQYVEWWSSCLCIDDQQGCREEWSNTIG